MKKSGPKKRAFGRICVSLGKGQKRGLTAMAKDLEFSMADLIRHAIDKTYGKQLRNRRISP
jgi:hypothetical protein